MVEMVDSERVGLAWPSFPSDEGTAPVAWMDACSDGIEQDDPMR